LSAVFSTSTAAPAPVAEASPVFRPADQLPLSAGAASLSPSLASRAPLPDPSAAGTSPAAMVPATEAAGDVPNASWIACPACGDRQPMRLLCRACGTDLKRALAAQQEAREQSRAAGGGRGGAKPPTTEASAQDDGLRILGFRVPDDWVAKLTWPNVLLALFGSLLVLVVIGFLWRSLGLDPLFSPSKPAPVMAAPPAANDPAPAASVSSNDKAAPAAVSSAPPEAEVAARLASAAAVAEFRLRYWPEPTSKVFVYASGDAMAWRGGSTSLTRAIAEAMSECESRRTASAPPCKLVNVNNYWQE
jgi:hypothetical protein